MAAASLFALASAASAATPPFANFTQISDVFNFTNPGVWEHHTLDVTGLVAGAAKCGEQASPDSAGGAVD